MNEPKFDYKYLISRFEPSGFILAEIPDIVRDELADSLNSIQDDSPKMDHRLKGHLEKQYTLPLTENIKYYTESLSVEYAKHLHLEDAYKYRDRAVDDYVLRSLWVNYQKKYDFNPPHNHAGAFSFVIWVQIPYELQDELNKYNANGPEASLFAFRYTSFLGGTITKFLPLDKTWEWKMAFFPAALHHSVNPFYTSDDYRISISGNVFLKEDPQGERMQIKDIADHMDQIAK